MMPSMPSLGHDAAFIIAAYAVTALVVLGLIVWVMLDRRAQQRALADLESRGIRRRSASRQPRTARTA